jgi:GNAT superfamily N-acetyltransferase
MMHRIRIVQEPATADVLLAYGRVSIAFRVESVLRLKLVDAGLGGARLVEEPVVEPYIKDYDNDPDDGPVSWARRWDTSNWAVFSAYEGDRRIGGAVTAVHNRDMWFLRARTDTAALWDIRVDWDYRNRGIGHRLFSHAIDWARAKGFDRLMIETQNVNVNACRFYQRQGCYLGAFEQHAYQDAPDEIELTWYYDLSSATH